MTHFAIVILLELVIVYVRPASSCRVGEVTVSPRVWTFSWAVRVVAHAKTRGCVDVGQRNVKHAPFGSQHVVHTVFKNL